MFYFIKLVWRKTLSQNFKLPHQKFFQGLLILHLEITLSFARLCYALRHATIKIYF